MRKVRGGWTLHEESEHVKAAWSSTCEEAMGRVAKKHKGWITPEALYTIQQRKEFKGEVNNSISRAENALV